MSFMYTYRERERGYKRRHKKTTERRTPARLDGRNGLVCAPNAQPGRCRASGCPRGGTSLLGRAEDAFELLLELLVGALEEGHLLGVFPLVHDSSLSLALLDGFALALELLH